MTFLLEHGVMSNDALISCNMQFYRTLDLTT